MRAGRPTQRAAIASMATISNGEASLVVARMVRTRCGVMLTGVPGPLAVTLFSRLRRMASHSAHLDPCGALAMRSTIAGGTGGMSMNPRMSAGTVVLPVSAAADGMQQAATRYRQQQSIYHAPSQMDWRHES